MAPWISTKWSEHLQIATEGIFILTIFHAEHMFMYKFIIKIWQKLSWMQTTKFMIFTAIQELHNYINM